MGNGYTYGINFPFRDSFDGRYLDLSDTGDEEIRTDLIHLLLTRKGSRYFLPSFGTRLYEYLFEPMDGPTFSEIDSEIRDTVLEFIPGITITNISIKPASEGEEGKGSYVNDNNEKVFRVPGISEKEHTAIIKIDYINTSGAFDTNDFVILNI